jgi:hypothetical protein
MGSVTVEFSRTWVNSGRGPTAGGMTAGVTQGGVGLEEWARTRRTAATARFLEGKKSTRTGPTEKFRRRRMATATPGPETRTEKTSSPEPTTESWSPGWESMNVRQEERSSLSTGRHERAADSQTVAGGWRPGEGEGGPLTEEWKLAST